MKYILSTMLAFAFVLQVSHCFAQRQPKFVTDSLDAMITQAMKDFNVPGVAVLIVKDGKVVLQKGYGLADVAGKKPVNENTLFAIASNTKLFAGTTIAWAAHEKKLSLDDKVTKHLPNFSMSDPDITRMVTIRDMLSHRVGLKTFQGDFTFWESNLTTPQLMDRFKLMPTSTQFRQDFGYCNTCYVVADEAMKAATGKSWDEITVNRIFKPLGMERTAIDATVRQKRDNVANAYTTLKGQLDLVPAGNDHNFGPAASIYSSVADLGKWVMTQIDSGKYQGKQVIPYAVLSATRQPNTIRYRSALPDPSSKWGGYGLGVFSSQYHGKMLYSHTGGALGMISHVSFMPEEKLGVVVLTNNDFHDLITLIPAKIYEAYLQPDYRTNVAVSTSRFKDYVAKQAKNTAPLAAAQTVDAKWAKKAGIEGQFSNTLYGPITIVKKGKDYVVNFPLQDELTAKVGLVNDTLLALHFSDPAYGISPAKLKTDKSGKLQSLDIQPNPFIESDSYLFVRKD